MKIEKIGKRGVFFTFGEGDSPFEFSTSVYLINAKEKVFLCDTHTGPKSMDIIKEYISANGWSSKELIVFNSHSDWDHVWGNCAFGGVTIIGHEKTKNRMRERGSYDLERLRRFRNGEVELMLPNLTFAESIEFEEEGIEFVYAPGHTVDSSICIDNEDSVIFAGDLIEYPLPLLNHYDLQGYLQSLEAIRDRSAEVILSAHSGIVSKELLGNSIDYIRDLIDSGIEMSADERDEEWQDSHFYNVKNIMFQRYVDAVKQLMGDKFDHKHFIKEFWNSVDPEYNNTDMESTYFHNTDYKTLEAAIKSCMAKLCDKQ